MTTEKNHLKGKLEVANTLGESLDKALEAAEFEAQQLLGGEAALKEAAKKILLLHAHVDADHEGGRIPGSYDLELVSYIKRKITQAHESCLNLAELAKSKQLVANGKAAALRPAVEMAQRQAVAARARLEQLYAQETELSVDAASNKKQKKKPESKLDDRRKAAAIKKSQDATESGAS